MAKKEQLFIALILVFYQLMYALLGHNIEYVEPTSCSSWQYFNIANMSCRDCRDTSSMKQSLDGFSCICKPGYRTVHDLGESSAQFALDDVQYYALECEPCPDGHVASEDGHHCVICDILAAVTNGSCSSILCGSDTMMTPQYSLSGSVLTQVTCASCATGSHPVSAGLYCQQCPFSQLFATSPHDPLTSGTCSCPSSLQVGDSCFPGSLVQSLPDVDTNIYYGSQSSLSYPSPLLENSLASSYLSCKEYQNVTACQLLGNLCTLSLYDVRSSDSWHACQLYEEAADWLGTRSGNNIEEWPKNMPWLFYPEGEFEAVTTREDLLTMFTLDSSKETSFLKVVAAKYTLEGNFVGYVDVWKTGEIQLCNLDPLALKQFFQFGKQYFVTCKIDIRSLFEWNSPIYFYDLYIKYTTSSGSVRYYALPQLVDNYATSSGNNVNPNTRKNVAYRRLTRRLFVVDTVSSARNPTTKIPDQVRYLNKIHLFVSMMPSGDPGAIYPPYLELGYETLLSSSDYNAGVVQYVMITMETEYKMKFGQFDKDLGTVLGVVGGLGLFYAILQVSTWRRRAGLEMIDMFGILKFWIYWFGASANVFFFCTFLAQLYVFIMWRNQDVIVWLYPTKERKFKAYLYTAFSIKIIEVIHIVMSQTMIDIFFIDWERPKTHEPSTTSSSQNLAASSHTAPGKESETTHAARGKMAPKSGRGGVSIWRTYFVANEWNEIQTIRKTSMAVQIPLTIFLLEVSLINTM